MGLNTLTDTSRDPHEEASRTTENGERFSSQLSAFLDDCAEDEIKLQYLLDALGSRAFGPVFLVLGLLCVLPTNAVPGLPTLVGLALIPIAAQILMRRRRPWIPKRAANISLKKDVLETAFTKASPYLEKVERVVHPRWHVFASPRFVRLVSVALLLLGLVMLVPVPFNNFLPGLSITAFALGLIASDGVAVLIGLILAIAAIVLVILIVAGVLGGLAFGLTSVFG